jgi:hypothetical protein
MKIPFLTRLMEIKEKQLILESKSFTRLDYISKKIFDIDKTLTKLQRRKNGK